MARLGLLDDAAPLFGSSPHVAHAGALLAVPALIASGIFDCAEKIYGSLGSAFFGLRTTLPTLLFMVLWRFKRPEGLKEHPPAELGRVLGLDCAPEVKTLRRKPARLAACQRATEFGQALAQERVARGGQALGFLYVDGPGEVGLEPTHALELLALGPESQRAAERRGCRNSNVRGKREGSDAKKDNVMG